MRGILLAGGNATRLHPITFVTNKHLLPIYNKPMIYYSLSTLMLAGIREVLIISSPRDIDSFKEIFGDGSQIGMSFSYKVQDKPKGIVECFLIGEEFIANEDVCLALGDNIFYGANFAEHLQKAKQTTEQTKAATIFGYYVADPERYGVIGFDSTNKVTSIEEKPKNPKSNYAVIGLYFYPSNVVEYAKTISPSKRGELEITDVNNLYLQNQKLHASFLDEGFAWLDTGTCESLMQASNFIQAIETRQNLMVASIEQIAFKMGYIDKTQLINLAAKMQNVAYGKNLLKLAESCN